MTVLVLLALVLVSLSPVLPRASATVTTGVTAGIVNLGQPIRDSSSATPVLGFGMTSNVGTDSLRQVTVSFSGSGWTPGDNRELRTLTGDPRTSGVGIFRDTGTVDDALDANDGLVFPSSIGWSGNDVVMTFPAGGEPVPQTLTGNFQWILVIRTSVNNPVDLQTGRTIIATLKAGSVIANSGLGVATQPVADVSANPLTVDLTRIADLAGPSPWIGPASALVNAKAIMGIRIVDGGMATNRGIQDTVTSLTFDLRQTAGAISAGDFQAISTNPATSGVALYRDDGTTDDAWDAADSGITPATISPTTFPAGGATFTLTFAGNGLDVPNTATGAFDFFVVLRTRNIVTGDRFSLRLNTDGVHVRGLIASMLGAPDGDLVTPSSTSSTSEVRADSTPPRTQGEFWFSFSNYAVPQGLTLHFSHAMGSTVVFNAVVGQARDDDSGLLNATFTSEPSLVSSPVPQSLGGAGWQFYVGVYGFNASSLDTSSPIDVTISDQVGNTVRESALGHSFRYVYEASNVVVLPNPGWTNTGFNLWVDGAGKLWFSKQLFPSSSADVSVLAASLSGAELTSVVASTEPNVSGPVPPTATLGAGTFNTAWTTTYTVNATASDSASPVTITATDNLGNTGSATFAYGLDTAGPSISFVNPASGSALSGNLVVRSSVADDHTAVQAVTYFIQTNGGWIWGASGIFDGTNYIAPFATAQIPDGNYQLSVVATDMVGNSNVVTEPITVRNLPDTATPAASVARPLAGDYLSGIVTLNASLTDNVGVASATYALVRVTDGVQVASGALVLTSGTTWQASINTASIADGDYQLTVTALDAAGNSGTSPAVVVHVDNTAPMVAWVKPLVNSYIYGLYTASVSASGGATSVGYALRRVSDGFTVYGAALALDANGYWESTLDTSGVADGDYNAVATAQDVLGRTATATVAVYIDNHAPALEVSGPTANAYVSNSVTIDATATDVHLASVQYSVDSGPWVAIATALDTTKLPDGTHALKVQATDAAGWASQWEASIVVDNTAPTATLVAPAPGPALQGISTYRVYAWDAVGVRGVSLTLAGQTYPMAFDGQTGYWEYTVDTRAWSDGSYTAVATATDLSGKQTSTPALAFTTKNAAPPPDYVTMFSAMLPLLAFFVAIVFFGLALGLLKSGAIARWLHPSAEEPLVEVPDRAMGRPPAPPQVPPP